MLKNKFQFYKQLHLQDDTIDNWDYYEFELHIKNLNDCNEEEKKHREEEDRKQKKSTPNFNPSSYLNYAKGLGKK